MKMSINVKDLEYEPRVLIDEETGRICQIDFDAPFILAKKEKTKSPDHNDLLLRLTVSKTKECAHCHKDKTREEYYPSSTSATRVQPYCIICTNEKRKKHEARKKARNADE